VRLKEEKQQPLLEKFEEAWCPPKDPNNGGNLAPWMSLKEDSSTTYETIWHELVDLYPFVEELDKTSEQSIESEAEVS
jgi:CRISPR-associated protein Cmr2